MSGGNGTEILVRPREGPHRGRDLRGNRRLLRPGRDPSPGDRDRRLSLHRRHRSPAYLAAWLIIPGEGEKISVAQGILGKKLNA